VDRCIKPQGFGEIIFAECHHFSDASETGYGIVTYIRMVSSEGQVHCCLVQSKSRVAPLKHVSRIDAMLSKELDIAVYDSYFWTDSMTVIKYVRNETSRFQTFCRPIKSIEIWFT
jgi:hypothetical protein